MKSCCCKEVSFLLYRRRFITKISERRSEVDVLHVETDDNFTYKFNYRRLKYSLNKSSFLFNINNSIPLGYNVSGRWA